MKTHPVSRPWTILVLAAAAAGAYLCFGYLPGEASLDGLRGELAAVEESIQQAEMLAPAIEATRQQSGKTAEYVRKWEQSAPSEDQLSELFGRINRLAEESGATTTRFEPQPPVPYDTICRLPVQMGCAGSFGQIGRFLRALECLDQTVWIGALRMEQAGENREDVHCELTLDIFADNSGGSDQVGRSEQPIREETD